MTSKLPVRRNIAPLFKIAENLERTLNLNNDKIYRKFSANFDGQKNVAKSNKTDQLIKTPVMHHQLDPKPEKVVHHNLKVSRETSPINSESEILKSEDEFGGITKNNWKSLLKEKDDQIDTLVAHMDELHSHNKRFAAENERILSKQCDSCAEFQISLEQHRSENEHQTKQNQQLIQDVRMMKTLVYRLNVQLERHQDELRRNNIEIVQNNKVEIGSPGHQERLIMDWGAVNAHTLAPLLQAYSEMVSEKDDLMQQYEQELTLFTGRLKEVLVENERLHDEMDECRRKNESWSTDQTRLQAQLDIFRTKAEVQSKRADLAKEKLVEVLRCYEQKVQSQHLDIQRLQEAYSRSKGELTALRGLNQNPEVLVESLKECQKLFEELKSQHDTEKIKLQADCEALRNRLHELEDKKRQDSEEFLQLKACNREINEANKSLTKKNDALRQSLCRVRLSRESFRNRLKSSTKLERKMEYGQQLKQKNWQDINNVENLLRQKENQVQTVHARYMNEIEKLTRKLQQRDDTLRRVLHAKSSYGQPANKPAAVMKTGTAVHSSYPISSKDDRD